MDTWHFADETDLLKALLVNSSIHLIYYFFSMKLHLFR